MYATQQDLIDRFGETELAQLSDRAGSGAIDPAVVARKLADAAAEIDSYLVGRYTLPLNPVPTVLVRLACDLARYHLYDDRATEQVAQRYRDAIRFLEQVAKGAVQLGVVPDGTPAVPSAAPEFDAPPRVFDRKSLRDFLA
ncbi:MAG: gp436 family protein [Pseudomonadota bacterium]